MKSLHIPFCKEITFFSSVASFYGLTLLLLVIGLRPVIPGQAVAFAQEPSFSATVKSRQVNKPKKPKVVISGRPVSIYIPRLQLKQDVILGTYDSTNGSWSISPRGIHFAVLSSPVNDNSGNSLIYSHNGQYTFGKLYLIRNGDTVEITTDTGYKFTYTFEKAVDYNPADTSIFSYSGPPILTLQTCSGNFNEYRRLYTFDLASVEKV